MHRRRTTRVLYHFDNPNRGNARDTSKNNTNLKLLGATPFPEEVDDRYRDTLETLWRQGAKIQFAIERSDTPVEAITLEGNSFDPADSHLLLEIPELPTVDLVEFTDVSPVLKTLSQSSTLRTLFLSRCDTSSGQLQHLPEFQSLSELRLNACDLSSNGLATIAQTTSIRTLGLGGCDLGEHGFRHLETMNLTGLYVTECALGDDGMERIGLLEQLSSLVLLRANVTPDGLPYITGCGSLRRVTLTDAPIDDTGLKYLGSLPELQHLQLTGTNISDEGLQHLNNARNLDWLFVARTFVTEDGVEALKKSLPDLNISWNAQLVRSRSELLGERTELLTAMPAVVSTDGAVLSVGPLKLRDLDLGQRLEIADHSEGRMLARLKTAEGGSLYGYINSSDISIFTRWYSPFEYQKELDRQKRSGQFPLMVEGRETNGLLHYRAAFSTKTAGVTDWYSGYGLPRSTFDSHNELRSTEGISLLTSTSCRTRDGTEWLHATWVNRTKREELRSALPSLEEQSEALFTTLDTDGDSLLAASEVKPESEVHGLLADRGIPLPATVSPAKFADLLSDAVTSEGIDAAEETPVESFLLTFDQPPRASRSSVPPFAVAHSFKPDWTSPFTVEAWVTPNQLDGHREFLCDAQRAGFAFKIHDGICKLVLHDGTEYRTVSSLKPLRQSVATHVAGQFDGSKLNLFIDGVAQGDATDLTGTPRLSVFPLHIGGNPGAGGQIINGFSGSIDEVRVSNITRYTGNFTPPRRLSNDAFTTALFHFDEGDGLTASDSSDHGNDLTLRGAGWSSEAAPNQSEE